MRLALLLVLATMAVFCHSATAVACPALWNAAAKFLYGSVQDYVDAITPFAQTPIMQATERQLKQCVQDSVTDKTALAFLVTQIIALC